MARDGMHFLSVFQPLEFLLLRKFCLVQKLVKEGAGNTLEVISIGKDFLNRTPAAQQLKERMDKWDFIKLKNFYTTEEIVSKLKRPPTGWEKIFASCISDKGLITRKYRELKQLTSPKINEHLFSLKKTKQNKKS
jgi:hypothetical protein